MNEMIRKTGQIIDCQIDEIIKAQSEGREVQALTILHTLDALDCYRRIKSHFLPVIATQPNMGEIKKQRDKEPLYVRCSYLISGIAIVISAIALLLS